MKLPVLPYYGAARQFVVACELWFDSEPGWCGFVPAKHIPCGPFETKSEEDALNYLAPRLDAPWVLLSNLQHSEGQLVRQMTLICSRLGQQGYTLLRSSTGTSRF